MDFREKRVRQF